MTVGARLLTLGNQVADWIEDMLVFASADHRGEPFVLDDDEVRFLQSVYEVRTDGRRRWSHAQFSRPKGAGKTELASAIAAAELLGPVRFDGLNAHGEPVGAPIRDPQVIFAALEEQQAAIGYGGALFMLQEGRAADEYHLDAGMTRTNVLEAGGGSMRAVSASASSKEGLRSSFVVCDETWLWRAVEARRLFMTLRTNLSKRPQAQPWLLEATTAPAAGVESIAASTRAQAATALEARREPLVLIDTRQALEGAEVDTDAGLLEALSASFGSAIDRADVDHIRGLRDSPEVGEAEWRRRYLNLSTAPDDAWLDAGVWLATADPTRALVTGDRVALGFDGSDSRDATALVASRLSDGHLELLGLWEPSPTAGRPKAPRSTARPSRRPWRRPWSASRSPASTPIPGAGVTPSSGGAGSTSGRGGPV